MTNQIMNKELNCCIKFIRAWILLYCFMNTTTGLVALVLGDIVRDLIQHISGKLNLGPYIVGAIIIAMSIIGIYGVIEKNAVAVSLFGLYFLSFLMLFIFKVEHEQLKPELVATIYAVLLGGSIPPFILSYSLVG